MNLIRLSIFLVGLVSVFALSPWVTAICILLLCIRYRAWEAIILGFLVDMLWQPAAGFSSLPLFTLGSVILVWILEPLRLEFLR